MKILGPIAWFLTGCIVSSVGWKAHENGDLQNFLEQVEQLLVDGVASAESKGRIHSEWLDPTIDDFTVDEISGQYVLSVDYEHSQDFKITIDPTTKNMEVWQGPGFGKPALTYILTFKLVENTPTWLGPGKMIMADRRINFDGTSTVYLRDRVSGTAPDYIWVISR